ncbi:MAG: UDP-glucose 4-epimerase GalE [Formivibrio sp.]|nr:UDP-glucose 4-epimerase GalE [Formivibrio sp.]
MTSVLVTGGAGYIGSHTCMALAANGMTPIVFDNLFRGHADFVRWGPLIVGDILDQAALNDTFARYRPDAVIHFAALAYVGESFSNPMTYYKNNVSGLVNIIEAMVKNGTQNIILSSSCTIYGIPDTVPIPENAPQRPISPYGRSKLFCEQILKDAAASNDLNFVIFRYFNASGADASGDLSERHDPETHLVPLAIDAATNEGPALPIFGSDYATTDGTCERDFIHVSDLASAHVEAISYLSKNANIALNLGTGRAHSVLQVVSAVERVTGRPVPLTWGPRRPGDPPILFSDPTLAQRLLRFRPKYSDLETIIETAWRSRRGQG